jgi:pimeloyl-ACP methyl ester carboxylesterase
MRWGSTHLVGNSMGGHSATAFALANPGRVGKLVLMGGGTGGPSLYAPMPTEGIKLLQGLYREPTIEKLKAMMAVFVYDPGALTEAQMQMRLDNMLARRDHLENFVKSLAANPRQFPDQNARLSEIAAPTLIVWGRDDRFVPMDVGCGCWRASPIRSFMCLRAAATGPSGNTPTRSTKWCSLSSNAEGPLQKQECRARPSTGPAFSLNRDQRVGTGVSPE